MKARARARAIGQRLIALLLDRLELVPQLLLASGAAQLRLGQLLAQLLQLCAQPLLLLRLLVARLLLLLLPLRLLHLLLLRLPHLLLWRRLPLRRLHLLLRLPLLRLHLWQRTLGTAGSRHFATWLHQPGWVLGCREELGVR